MSLAGFRFPFGVTIRFIGRNGKRIAVSIAGFALVLAGLAMSGPFRGPGSSSACIAGSRGARDRSRVAQTALNYTKREASEAKDRVLRKKPPALSRT